MKPRMKLRQINLRYALQKAENSGALFLFELIDGTFISVPNSESYQTLLIEAKTVGLARTYHLTNLAPVLRAKFNLPEK